MNKQMKTILLLLWGLVAAACGGNAGKYEEASVRNAPLVDEKKNYLISEGDDFDDVEACSIARPGDCIRPPQLGTKAITVCGYKLNVPVLSALVCQASLNALPVGCTIATAATMGGTCALNITAVIGSCGVSTGSIYAVTECCRKGGC